LDFGFAPASARQAKPDSPFFCIFGHMFCRFFSWPILITSNPTAPVPEIPYELIRIKGVEAVERCLSWREEWRGSFTPVILGTIIRVGRPFGTWGFWNAATQS
jgi:hypothetical protein